MTSAERMAREVIERWIIEYSIYRDRDDELVARIAAALRAATAEEREACAHLAEMLPPEVGLIGVLDRDRTAALIRARGWPSCRSRSAGPTAATRKSLSRATRPKSWT